MAVQLPSADSAYGVITHGNSTPTRAP